MITREQYLDETNWLGSFYELSLELGPTGDDALAHRALTRLWRSPALQGPWTQRRGFMAEPEELRVSADQVDMATNPWMYTLDQCLAEIACDIFEVAPFGLGLLGEEASGACTSAELTRERCELGGYLVPDALWTKLQPSRPVTHLSAGLVYAPFREPHITSGG